MPYGQGTCSDVFRTHSAFYTKQWLALPTLKNANPTRAMRLVDGTLTRDAV